MLCKLPISAMKQVILLLILVSSSLALADKHYIKPTQSTPCPEKGNVSCMTLSQIAVQSRNSFSPNTTLILLPGEHNLHTTLEIQNITNLLIQTHSTVESTTISCTHSEVLFFERIGHIHISGLSLIDCEGRITLIEQFSMENCDLLNRRHNSTGLMFSLVASIIITDIRLTTMDSGIQINSSSATIVDSSFSGSNVTEECSILYITNSEAILKESTFSNNLVVDSSMVQIDSSSTVTMFGLNFQNNKCLESKDQGCAVDSTHSILHFSNTVFTNNTVHGENSQGAPLSSSYGAIDITNCTFVNNSGGLCGGAVCAQFTIVSIANSIFSSNKADHGGAISIVSTLSTVIVNNCTFFDNTALNGGGLYITDSNFVLINSTFFHCRGRGGGMLSYRSNISIVNTTFIENRALLDSFGIADAAKGNLINVGGAIYTIYCFVTVHNSSFVKNTAEAGSEVLLETLATLNHSTQIQTMPSKFTAYAGGIYTLLGFLFINNCTFVENKALTKCQHNVSQLCTSGGGAILAVKSYVNIKSSQVLRNTVTVSCRNNNSNHCQTSRQYVQGGALLVTKSTLLINGTKFIQNKGNVTCCFNGDNFKERAKGGALFFTTGNNAIYHSTFHDNTAEDGGAIATSDSWNTIDHSNFTNNKASNTGGGVWYKSVARKNYTLVVQNSTFVSNTAQTLGGAIIFTLTTFLSNGYLYVANNTGYSIITAENSAVKFNGSTKFVHNTGSALSVRVSNVTFGGSTDILYTNTSYLKNSEITKNIIAPLDFARSELVMRGTVNIMHNNGVHSGAIYITEGTIDINAAVQITNNTASLYGGGIYAYKTEMTFRGRCVISENIAGNSGGGIYTVTGTISVLAGSLLFHKNHATINGGGIYLESNTKLYIVKSIVECKVPNKLVCSDEVLCSLCNSDPYSWTKLDFIENSANYGGALFVSDYSYSDICSPLYSSHTQHTSECFIQTIATYLTKTDIFPVNLRNIRFENNTATIAGNTIYGGLLDRCTVSSSSEINKYLLDNGNRHIKDSEDMTGYQVLANISNLKVNNLQQKLGSLPASVCFCHDHQPDCDYQPPTVYARKGEHFRVSAAAIDQVTNTVPNTTIHSAVSEKGGLGEGQALQLIDDGCTELEYSIFSPHDSEQVVLYAEGPCKDRGISKATFNITFVPCPIGFEDTETKCECDLAIFPNYTTNCSIDNEKVLRKDNAWIGYVNTSDYTGYLLHHHCPFDYCVEANWINLNAHNGTDDQCDFNRTGKLCGSCKEGFSLLLGTSRCSQCSNGWLGFLLVFAVIGIALVVFLLVFNFTVDVGTINGFILYANIVATNSAIFIPFKTPSVLSVFIAWLNLDFGFEICFFDGMDGYAKTWLQFVFPLYTILLVVTIIVVVGRSERLTELLRTINKNPVATLATLILLSYTKILRTIITALSFTRVSHQYGSDETVWLMDGNVHFLNGKHIYIFTTALLFLIIGLVYTSGLLLWQWIIKLVQINGKLYAFMDAYQNPYNLNHRYWSGLLLLVRLVLYLVSALNVSGDPSVNILSVICTVGGLLLLKEGIATNAYKQWMSKTSHKSKKTFSNMKIYKKWALNALETSILFNILIFAAATLYVKGIHSQQILAYISVSIVFTTFLGVLVYHTYIYVVLKLVNQVRNSFGLNLNTYTRVRSNRENDHINLDVLIDNSEAEVCTEINGVPLVINTDDEHNTETVQSLNNERDGQENNEEEHVRSEGDASGGEGEVVVADS